MMGIAFSCGGSKKKAKRENAINKLQSIQQLQLQVDSVDREKPTSKNDKTDDLLRLDSLVAFVENVNTTKADDIDVYEDLGSGSFGCVKKVFIRPLNQFAARKTIVLCGKDEKANCVLREISALKLSKSPYITSYMGHYKIDNKVHICMEYMDIGSVSSLMLKVNRFPECIISLIARSVLKGIKYLVEEHSIIHRDVKPPNILINSKNEIKLGDLGLACKIDKPITEYIGDPFYMSPERSITDYYDVKADIWSLGISLLELAFGCYPYPPPPVDFETVFSQDPNGLLPRKQRIQQKDISYVELLCVITTDYLPRLPSEYFKEDFISFIDSCLKRDPNIRSDLDTLLSHPFIADSSEKNVDNDWFRTANQFPEAK